MSPYTGRGGPSGRRGPGKKATRRHRTWYTPVAAPGTVPITFGTAVHADEGTFPNPVSPISLGLVLTAGQTGLVGVLFTSGDPLGSSTGPTGGGTWTKLVEIAAGTAKVEIWATAPNGATATSSVSIAHNALLHNTVSVVGVAVSGTIASFGNTPTNSGAGANPTINTVLQEGTNFAVAFFCSDQFTDPTALTGTLLEHFAFSSSSTKDLSHAAVSNTSATPATVTCAITLAAADWAAAAVELRTPVAGGGGTTFPITLAGVLSFVGQLSIKVKRQFAGALTPAGALSRKPKRAFTGAITPAGALTKKDKRSFSGTIGPTGTLVRKPKRSFSGLIGPSGVITTVKKRVQVFAGTIAPIGTLTKKVKRAFTGTVAPTGTVTRKTSRKFSGVIAPAGALIRKPLRKFAGLITPSGAITVKKTIKRAFSGAIGPAGVLTTIFTPGGGGPTLLGVLRQLRGWWRRRHRR